MTDLLELATRCEQATGPDSDLDLAIATASYDHGFPIFGQRVNYEPALWLARYGPITASLDAAMTLVPEGWSIGLGDLRGYDPPLWRAHLRDHNNPDASRRQWVEGNTTSSPALALCAAALRARAASQGEG